MSDLLDALEVLKDNGFAGLDIEQICMDLLDKGDLYDPDDRKKIALCAHLKGETCIHDVSHDADCRFTVGSAEYLVLTGDEQEQRWDDCLEDHLDNGEVEGSDSRYFDREAWKHDARMDGAGWALGAYDNNEWEVAEFFIYRTG